MGDDEGATMCQNSVVGANRVLHVAYRQGQLLGCCSSTLQPPWTPRNCGHWGLLSVHPDAQGTGVASALIEAAERRLLEAGCRSIQIEYEFTAGDPDSERLLQWYEGKCGFKSGSPPTMRGSEFRCCRKKLTEDSCYKSSGVVAYTAAFESQHTHRGVSRFGSTSNQQRMLKVTHGQVGFREVLETLLMVGFAVHNCCQKRACS
eukprot:Skav206333  [mRNA]  locus=scaffold1420:308203:314882:- [translate_table: standard]